jgi:hypothetical protein
MVARRHRSGDNEGEDGWMEAMRTSRDDEAEAERALTPVTAQADPTLAVIRVATRPHSPSLSLFHSTPLLAFYFLLFVCVPPSPSDGIDDKSSHCAVVCLSGLALFLFVLFVTLASRPFLCPFTVCLGRSRFLRIAASFLFFLPSYFRTHKCGLITYAPPPYSFRYLLWRSNKPIMFWRG